MTSSYCAQPQPWPTPPAATPAPAPPADNSTPPLSNVIISKGLPSSYVEKFRTDFGNTAVDLTEKARPPPFPCLVPPTRPSQGAMRPFQSRISPLVLNPPSSTAPLAFFATPCPLPRSFITRITDRRDSSLRLVGPIGGGTTCPKSVADHAPGNVPLPIS